ncbi:MAG: PLP-dependent aminotransferase family protein [Tetragenococcus sp.]|nr:PLP-dependent aminotransferase family protein [Tetragenococcus sp.]
MLKHQFVAKQVLNRIDEKIYAEKLPSIRALMDEFQVSQATVTQALRQLIELNKVYVQENVGYFIIPKKQIPDEREEIFDFSTTSTSWTDFPLDSYAQCLEIALKNEKNELFTYGAVDGNHELKKSFQKLLEEEQIFARTDQIVITSGSQQALHILALMLKGTDSILIEQPTYHLMVKLIERLNLSYITCHRETNKVDLATLQKTIERDHPKYVYLMPRLHNPLGTTMTEHEKKVILDYAKSMISILLKMIT